MPKIEATQRKQVIAPTPSGPAGTVPESSPHQEEQLWDEPAITEKATRTRLIRSSSLRCLLAVPAVGLALLIRVALAPYSHLPPYHTFYAFVLLMALLGGIWAGLLTTGLSALVAVYWVIPSNGQFFDDAISSVIFCTTGACVSVVAELYNRKRNKLATANAQLRAEITERKRVGDELHISEEKFAKAFANNPVAIGITRLKDGVFLEVNDTWVELVGYSREEMIGRSSRRMIWPTRDATARCLRKLREKGSLRGWKQEFLKKSGEVFVTEMSAQIWILNGKKLVVTTLVDITARKQSETALQDSESRFRTFFDTVAMGTAELDASGHFLHVNQRLCQITGYSSEELLGMTVVDLMHPEDRDRDKERLELHLREDFPAYEFERRCVRKDGRVIWVQVTAAAIRSSEGKLQRSARIIQDISERKQAQEALRVSEERLRLLGDNLPNSVVYQYMHEPDGRPRFLYMSAGVERLNGVKAEDVLNDAHILYDQVVPEELPAMLAAEKVSARELSGFEREVRMRLPDGRLRWMHLLSRPRHLPDGRTIWDGVETDITERKLAEEALLRSEKLASLGRMAATIAHEINNPLDAVMNLLFLAADSKEVAESTRYLLETADAELKRIAHITRQSLGFYRESNAPTLTSVNAVLDSVVELLKSKIKAKHAIIDKQWTEDVKITAVAGELRQVFSNLVSNSLDAIDERGTVKLRISTGIHRVRVTVADNGSGIPPSTRRHIFEPFFTTKDAVGTGLGLWVSEQIVEKHGGTIQVRSRSDGLWRGTTFSVLLPVGPMPAAQSLPAAA
jgi:PAS domain S-box-containing protein